MGFGIGIGIGWPNASASAGPAYPLSVCSQIKIQGGTKNAYGTLNFTSLDINGYPQYFGIVGSGFPASLQYNSMSQWQFTTPTEFDTITSIVTTSLDPTTVLYSGYSLLSGACLI